MLSLVTAINLAVTDHERQAEAVDPGQGLRRAIELLGTPSERQRPITPTTLKKGSEAAQSLIPAPWPPIWRTFGLKRHARGRLTGFRDREADVVMRVSLGFCLTHHALSLALRRSFSMACSTSYQAIGADTARDRFRIIQVLTGDAAAPARPARTRRR
jgi:hypothetical protein